MAVDVAGLLPHAHPFRFVDRVIESDPGQSALALRLVTSADPSIGEGGVLPPVLLAEAMAQVAGIAAGAQGEYALIAQMARVRFRAVAQVSDELLVAARVVRRFGKIAKVRAIVRVGTRRCAAAEILLSFARRPEDAP